MDIKERKGNKQKNNNNNNNKNRSQNSQGKYGETEDSKEGITFIIAIPEEGKQSNRKVTSYLRNHNKGISSAKKN